MVGMMAFEASPFPHTALLSSSPLSLILILKSLQLVKVIMSLSLPTFARSEWLDDWRGSEWLEVDGERDFFLWSQYSSRISDQGSELG
jgi:hypothetical protein